MPDQDGKSDKAQRLHDLNTVYADFNAVLNLLKSGYKFDDEDAAPALAQLERAIGLLKREIESKKEDRN